MKNTNQTADGIILELPEDGTIYDDLKALATEVAALRAENERLSRWRELIEKCPGEALEVAQDRLKLSELIRPFISEWKKVNTSLKAENERLRTALEHYADEANWKSGRGGTKRIYRVKSVADSGYDIAKAALTAGEGKEGEDE